MPKGARALKSYRVVLSRATLERVHCYHENVKQHGMEITGVRLRNQLLGCVTANLKTEEFLERLINTKVPMIFAESEVRGDGSDWTSKELSLLGDIGVAVEATIFDDGRHSYPRVHAPPFSGTLLFVPGALLRNDQGGRPADWHVAKYYEIDPDAYYTLYKNRLLPLLLSANRQASQQGVRAFITIPGLGCGQFSGPFRGQMGEHLKQALIKLLGTHYTELASVSALYYDPYNECQNERHSFGRLSFFVRPLTAGNHDKPQLCPPAAYEEEEDYFGDCRLFSFVAWDHVSWPGNDFYGGTRSTDDGVKAAATTTMLALTGAAGAYDQKSNCYLPPSPYRDWGQVVSSKQLRIKVEGHLEVFG